MPAFHVLTVPPPRIPSISARDCGACLLTVTRPDLALKNSATSILPVEPVLVHHIEGVSSSFSSFSLRRQIGPSLFEFIWLMPFCPSSRKPLSGSPWLSRAAPWRSRSR